MHWIQDDIVLEGEKVTLRALQPAHIEGLITAGRDPKIWEFLYPSTPDEDLVRNNFFNDALANREKGTQYAFTIFDKEENIIGTTRFGDIEQEHRKLEIGWTWYIPEVWGKGYNEECKYLLLSYCFDVLKAVRVQLKTSEKNLRSRRAILRLGCTFEGVLRNHIIRQGTMRNSAMFSMLPDEWEAAKDNLKAIYQNKYAGTYTYVPDIINEEHNGYTITTNRHLMQPERIHHWLSTRSYWLPGVPFSLVKTTFDSSFCIAVLKDGVQVGYARLVTDYAVFAYLADVYIEEEHRGQGLSKKMMAALLSLGWVQRLRKISLMTKDAQGLYAQFGFGPAASPERYMELPLNQTKENR